jgi:hypothetical protein
LSANKFLSSSPFSTAYHCCPPFLT